MVKCVGRSVRRDQIGASQGALLQHPLCELTTVTIDLDVAGIHVCWIAC